MNYLTRQIVFREIPDEISLSYLITGCSLHCDGCHSADSWSLRGGYPLTGAELARDLNRYQHWITCVLFMGGDWHQQSLCFLLDQIHQSGLKTALYTGADRVDSCILEKLDYLKTGRYLQKLGGLDSALTNQKLIEVKTGRVLNSFFIKQNQGGFCDSFD